MIFRLFARDFGKNFSKHFNRHFSLNSISSASSKFQKPLQSILLQQKRNASKASSITKAYGPVAFIVYSSLALPTFLGCLYSITYLGVTQKDIYRWLDKVKLFFGLEKTPPSEKTAEISRNWDFLPEWMKTEQFIEFGTNVLLAMVMTKIFSPLKFALTALLTPSAARLFQRFGWFVPKK